MDTKNDGGAAPAFPSGPYETRGMALRDYFAAAALSNPQIYGGAADSELIELFGKNRTAIRREEIVAARAYCLADAMIKARGE